MNSSLVYLRPINLAYVRVTGRYDESIPHAWERMFDWLESHGLNNPHGRGYGLARDNPDIVGAGNCRYDACIAITPDLEHRAMRDLGATIMPGGSFARMRRIGGYCEFHRTVAGILQTFEPGGGLKVDSKRPIVTIYLDDPRRTDPHDQRVELCVPVSVARGAGEAA